MAIFEMTDGGIVPLPTTTFAAEGWLERGDLQRLLRDRIEAIAPDTLILSEEFSDWDDSSRRVDLLGIDKQGNLVVIELKRSQGGGHMELQALRYAAMVSSMTFEHCVREFAKYLARRDINGDARSLILDFLSWDEPDAERFAQDVRIVLASAEFSKELTTSVLWLNDHDIDIRCVRLQPYSDGDRTFIDIQQVIPLPETSDYLVSLREKSAEERESRRRSEDWSGEYFVNVGMDDPGEPRTLSNGQGNKRHWQNCREFGYIAAGGAARFRNHISKLRVGDPIYAYVKGGCGYVGYGNVVSVATPMETYSLPDGTMLKDRIGCPSVNAGRDADTSEYVVGVKWQKTFPLDAAKTFPGAFANQNTVCRLRDQKTLAFLAEAFKTARAEKIK